MRILIVKLGAMGDVVHTLPAAASLRRGYPDAEIVWVIDPKWTPLLDGNPHIDSVIALNRRSLTSVRAAAAELREQPFDLAVDFQGLLKSGMVARASGAKQRWGFENAELREELAGMFYTGRAAVAARHVVDKNLELAVGAGGSVPDSPEFALPAGELEGELPQGPFVLACPRAGWASKEWPVEYYAELASLLPCPLVLNAPEAIRAAGCASHVSRVAGLIDATRRATAVVGVDSGPLHIAAALGKPGVAIFGPTDPGRNGPYGGSIRILRVDDAVTTHKRGKTVADSMRAITPQQVAEALRLSTDAIS